MADDRPKPKFGELAPQGWEWKPPAPPAGSDVPVPAAEGARAGTGAPPSGPIAPYPAPGPAGAGSSSAQGSGSAPGSAGPLKVGDAVATGLLLFIGILVSASMIPALFDFNAVLAQAAAMQGYGEFAASPVTQTVGLVAGVATVILTLLSIVLSVRRVQRRRVAFFVPLIFGAATFVFWIAAITFAFFSDPGFVQSLTSTVAPTP